MYPNATIYVSFRYICKPSDNTPLHKPVSKVESMAAKKKPAPYSRPRKSREQGAIALLDAAVELLTEKSPDDVTTAEIAERAGLNRAHIVRYFGNRGELLASAVEHFMNTGVLAEETPSTASIVERRAQFQSTVQWYMKVVSYLLSVGVPPQRFHTVQQAVSERVGHFMEMPGASPRLKSVLVKMAVLLMQATPVYGNLDELTDQDRLDLLLVMANIRQVVEPLDEALGWDK